MISLHEKLSEFSYGYGVTREVENLLASMGLRVTPFFPSLLYEGELGFDVALRFDRPGRFLFLQFKLGQELRIFRRVTPTQSIPRLARPFWRFQVDPTGAQFRHLKKLEDQGQDVYYVAPRFSDWSDYQVAYLTRDILDRSLTVQPSEILRNAQGASAHSHRVVYDKTRQYVCSDPAELEPVQWVEVAEQIERKVSGSDAESLRGQAERLWDVSMEELRSAIEALKGPSSLTASGDPNVQDLRRRLLADWPNLRTLETHVLCVTAADPT